MSADFVKVYSSFWTGSMRDQPPYARLLFLSLLDLCDSTGEVRATPAYMAAHAALSESDVRDSLERLMAPDPGSNCEDEEGRRILKTGPQTYRIVNYVKYYELHRAQERKEYLREAKRKQRSKDVNSCQQKSTCQPQKEKEKEKEKRNTPPKSPTGDLLVLPNSLEGIRPLLEEFRDHRKHRKSPMTPEGWRRLLLKLEKWGVEKSSRALTTSMENGWAGVFEPDEKSSKYPPKEDGGRAWLDSQARRTQEMLEHGG